MFSSTDQDPLASGRENYRKIREECSGLQIQTKELTAPAFRSLIQCFNANGSLPEIANLVSESTEKGLEQSVELLNDAFLRDPNVLRESREIMQKLQKDGGWKSGIKGFRPLLESPDKMRALVRLTALNRDSPSILVQTLDALEPRETVTAFELVGRLASSPAYKNLFEKMNRSPLSESERSRLASLFQEFLQKKTPHRSALNLVQDMAAGKSGSLWSYVLGEKTDDLLDATSRFYTLLKDFGAENGKPLRQLSEFHRSFHRPISCWNDGKTFLTPWKNLTSELRAHSSSELFLPFILRFAPTTALAVDGFCAVPNSFRENYSAATSLILGRSGKEYVEVLRQVFTSDLGESAGYFVGEWGGALSEVLSILEKKEWFSDLVLLIAELDSADRDQVATWASAFLRNQAKWSELSSQWSIGQIREFFSDFGSVLAVGPDAITSMMNSFHLFYEVSQNHPWFGAWKRIVLNSADNGLDTLIAADTFPAASIALGKMAEDGSLADLLSAVVELVSGSNPVPSSGPLFQREPSVRRPLRHLFSGNDLQLIDSTFELDPSLQACARLDLHKTPIQQWSVYEKCVSGGGVKTESLRALFTAMSWQVSSKTNLGKTSSGISESFVESLIHLPLSGEQKRRLLRAGFSADGILEIFQGLKKYTSVEIFRFLHRLETGGIMDSKRWRLFFQRFESVIEHPSLPSVYDAFNSLQNPAKNDPSALERLKTPRMPQLDSLAGYVAKVECETVPGGKSPLERAREVVSEYQHAVLGWEWSDGKLPIVWDRERLLQRVRAFSKTIESPALRDGLYRWLSGNSKYDLANWFFARSGDAVAVTVMGSDGALSVRWMSTLDRLESILVNSNFDYGSPFFSRNHGLRFIQKFAEAWGDEPRSAWPKEIQARYGGRKIPPTLRDVQNDVRKFIKAFEVYGGLPPIPNCAKATVGGAWRSNFLVSRDVQAKVFNLRQTLSVIDENLPDSEHPHHDGMRVLRDLFYAVQSSASHQNKEPLEFFQSLGDLGALRSVSRGLQTLKTREDYFALEDFFVSLGEIVKEPAFDTLISQILSAHREFDPWIEAAFHVGLRAQEVRFRWGTLISRLFSGIASDRSVGLVPVFLKVVTESLAARAFPEVFVAEGVRFLGETSRPDIPPRWMTLRAAPESKAETRKTISLFGMQSILPLLRAYPFGETLDLLNHDPMLRKDLWNEARKWTGSRQGRGEENPAENRSSTNGHDLFRSFFAKENPEIRRAVGLWCGKSAATYVSTLSARPDEAALMIDGLLESTSSPMMKDLIEAMLRQLPD